jgi:hypothetical protein
MKPVASLPLGLSLIGLALLACSGSTDSSAASQAGHLVVTVNGVTWRSQPVVFPDSVVGLWDPSDSRLVLFGFNESAAGGGQVEAVWICVPGGAKVGSFALGTPSHGPWGSYFPPVSATGISYATSDANRGQLRVHEWNQPDTLVRGSFAFSAADASGRVRAQVRGTFDGYVERAPQGAQAFCP